MQKEYDFDFLHCDYWLYYYKDPLWYVLINEQFYWLRIAFYSLDVETQNVLDYFIIQDNDRKNFELDKYIKRLKVAFLKFYEGQEK